MGAAQVEGERRFGCARELGSAQPLRGACDEIPGLRALFEACPRCGRVLPVLTRQLLVLLLAQQRGVVLRMPRAGESVPLDRVRDDRGGACVVDAGEGIQQGGDVVPAQIADRSQQRLVVEARDELAQRFRAVARAGQALAELVRIAAEQPLVLGVRHRDDPVAQVSSAGSGEQLLEQAPPPHGDDLPAGGLEHGFDAARGDVGDDAVQRLAVEVDDPHDLAQVLDGRIDDRLPHRALVQLRITHQ